MWRQGRRTGAGGAVRLNGDAELSPDEVVGRAGAAFATAWQQFGPPTIRFYLRDVRPDCRQRALVELVRRVERHYGCHQDVEWAIDRPTGELRLLQARPETVWSRRPAAVPAPAGALAALTATFTGGLKR